ncbi:major capsid protein [Apis mellifera associated microvirus 36]|nr:major capsid protein [Apis mellifera associated microvirus 36]
MNLFNQVQIRRPKRNKFDLSHEKKLSFNMGDLIPIMCQEIIPGDNFRVNTETFMRLAPMIAPVMHRVNVYTHYFFVPTRIIWDEFQDFITGGREGTSMPISPFFGQSTVENARGSLLDYMGLPLWPSGSSNDTQISVLPLRAYQTVWDEYFRDQNLTPSLDISKASGVMPADAELFKLLELRKRAWEKDYFTSALPWSQRGNEILLPMTPEVNYRPTSDVYYEDGTQANNSSWGIGEGPAGEDGKIVPTPGANILQMRIENIDSIDNVTTTINDLRRAVRLQEWLEKNARGGARYIEQILHHFGVTSSDARLQRPEYLGGGKQPVVISEVLQTSETLSTPQGTMAGHGVSAGTSNGFNRSFEEHGYVIGVMSVLPRTAYQDGVNKMWSRTDKFDYFWPELANIGEQEVKIKELYLNPTGAQTNDTFGYQSRYAEYKYMPSTVHGDFRTNLDYWHMGRKFSTEPVLNEDFITADPTHRIFAVTDPDEHKLYCQLYHRIDALRPMPYFGTPTL